MSDKLKQQVEKMEKTFETYQKEFARDGRISPQEAVILESVAEKLTALRKKMVEYNEKHGVVDFSDEPAQVQVAVKSYEDAVFTTAFAKSVKDWSQDGNIALNRVKTYFMKTDKPDGLGVSDLLAVVSLAVTANPKAAAVVGTITTIAGLVQNAYKASLPATPSLNEIHSAWAAALQSYGAGNHEVEYREFVEEWKAKNGVPADVQEVPVNSFLPACSSFGDTYLPTSAQVEKAFLTKILSKVEDSFDIDTNGLDQAGVADVRLIHLVGNFSQPVGQLDDVGEQLLEAVKTVWAKSRVYELPVQIDFSICNVNLAEMAVIQRSSRQPGDTSFKLKSGDQAIFDAFMKKKAYSIPRVSDLRVDS
jgi:hypothetical protein